MRILRASGPFHSSTLFFSYSTLCLPHKSFFNTSLNLSSDQTQEFLHQFQITMTRGNQREKDRERAQARAGHKPKNPKEDGLTPEQRRQRDAKALQEKLAKKAAQAAAGGFNVSGGKMNKK